MRELADAEGIKIPTNPVAGLWGRYLSLFYSHTFSLKQIPLNDLFLSHHTL